MVYLKTQFIIYVNIILCIYIILRANLNEHVENIIVVVLMQLQQCQTCDFDFIFT